VAQIFLRSSGEIWETEVSAQIEQLRSAHGNMGLRSLDPVQLLDLVDYKIVKSALIGRLDVDEHVRQAPTGVSVLHTRHLGNRAHNIPNLPWPHVNQHISPHSHLPLLATGPVPPAPPCRTPYDIILALDRALAASALKVIRAQIYRVHNRF
jgi:hypothetical protein